MPKGLAHDDIHVWLRATVPLDAGALAEATAMLSPDERARAGRFHFEQDRRDYIAAHALVRAALSAFDGRAPAALPFHTGPHGKPWLVAADGHPSAIRFNLSHTRGMVACAVAAGCDVGIDVEAFDREVDIGGISASFFSPAEILTLDGLAGDARRARFFELWTLKEALLKAVGVGLSSPLNEIVFEVRSLERIVLDAPPAIEAPAWQFALASPSPTHRLALAVRRRGAPARIFMHRWSALGLTSE